MRLFSIVLIFREEVQQQTLLVGDPVIKEVPRRPGIENRADRIVEEDLRADREVKPAGISGVAEKPAIERLLNESTNKDRS